MLFNQLSLNISQLPKWFILHNLEKLAGKVINQIDKVFICLHPREIFLCIQDCFKKINVDTCWTKINNYSKMCHKGTRTLRERPSP